MGDLKFATVRCAYGDCGRVFGACPSEIDACQYHGTNYMAVVRLRTDSVTIGLMASSNAGDGVVKWKNLNGSPGRARTADLVINSHPLYRLSYRGITSAKSYWMGR